MAKLSNIRPVGQRVLVEIVHEPPVTAGGLYRPHFEKFLLNEGVVKRVSADVTTLSPGDRVMLPRYEGMIMLDLDEGDTRKFALVDVDVIEGIIT